MLLLFCILRPFVGAIGVLFYSCLLGEGIFCRLGPSAKIRTKQGGRDSNHAVSSSAGNHGSFPASSIATSSSVASSVSLSSVTAASQAYGTAVSKAWIRPAAVALSPGSASVLSQRQAAEKASRPGRDCLRGSAAREKGVSPSAEQARDHGQNSFFVSALVLGQGITADDTPSGTTCREPG